jgi:hypothetical protein
MAISDLPNSALIDSVACGQRTLCLLGFPDFSHRFVG